MCGFYILRPVRDEMAIQAGVDQLQWLFTGTFLTMLAVIPLFGWLSSRFPRRQFMPAVYFFLCRKSSRFLRLVQRRSVAAEHSKGILYLVKRVQSVRCLRILELHGRLVQQRPVTPAVRIHLCRRLYRGNSRADHHRQFGAADWSVLVAADFRMFSACRSLLRSPSIYVVTRATALCS